MSRRRTFNTTEREAILHLRVLELEGRPIPLDVQKTLTAKEINSMWDADHYPIRHTDGGPTEPWNGQMLLNAKGAAFLGQLNEHGHKTATKDIPEIAKQKRVRERQAEFRHRLLARARGEPTERPAKGKYRWPKRHIEGWQRFDGTPVRAKP